MTRPTLGELWSRYFRVRGRIAAGGMSCVQLRSAEREVRGLRDRLVVNYSPLVRYVAGRTAGRVGEVPIWFTCLLRAHNGERNSAR
jgi:RNA polymerase sigma factor FliA